MESHAYKSLTTWSVVIWAEQLAFEGTLFQMEGLEQASWGLTLAGARGSQNGGV